jgi:hypothetical protein
MKNSILKPTLILATLAQLFLTSVVIAATGVPATGVPATIIHAGSLIDSTSDNVLKKVSVIITDNKITAINQGLLKAVAKIPLSIYQITP